MRGIGGRSKRKFLQLYTNIKRSRAYHGLNSYARSLLFELIDRYNGCNNGMIGLGVREAAWVVATELSAMQCANSMMQDW